MTIEQTRVIDMIADEAVDGVASLIIADHLEWGTSQPDHLLLLQEKINTYISFIESEEVYEGREYLRNRRLVIKVVGLYPPNSDGQEFYRRSEFFLRNAGMDLVFELKENALD